MRTADEIYEQYSLLCEEAQRNIADLMRAHGVEELHFGDNAPLYDFYGFDGYYECQVDSIVLNNGFLQLTEGVEWLRLKDFDKSNWIHLYYEVEGYFAEKNSK